MKASEGEGKGNKEERANRVRVGDVCVPPRGVLDPPAFILTSLSFYGLPCMQAKDLPMREYHRIIHP